MKFWARSDSWFAFANCGGSEDHTLPPSRTDAGLVACIPLVQEICKGCRVRPECARWAVEGNEHGVWACGTWIPGHDEDKKTAKLVRHNLFESIPGELERRGEDV